MLLGLSFLLERKEAVVTYAKYFGPNSAENAAEFNALLFGIIISSMCTFAISYSTSWCIRITGATTYRYRTVIINVSIVWWAH